MGSSDLSANGWGRRLRARCGANAASSAEQCAAAESQHDRQAAVSMFADVSGSLAGGLVHRTPEAGTADPRDIRGL